MSTTPKPETLETPLLKIEDDGLCRLMEKTSSCSRRKKREDEEREREIKENKERKKNYI